MHLAENPVPIVVIHEDSLEAKQAGVLTFEQRGHGREQNVFQSRAPGLAPNTLERHHDPGGDAVTTRGVGGMEQVETDRMLEVGRVEVDDILDAARGNFIEQVDREVPVRIDQTGAPSGVDVLEEKVAKQGRFACAGLADGVGVLPAILRMQPEELLPSPGEAVADEGEFIVGVLWVLFRWQGAHVAARTLVHGDRWSNPRRPSRRGPAIGTICRAGAVNRGRVGTRNGYPGSAEDIVHLKQSNWQIKHCDTISEC